MKNSLDKNAKWLLLFGILLTFLFPLLLPLLNKTGIGNFGVVGDAIGGITNPISQLIGSILLYLALKAQLSANGIVQNQIEKDNIKEEQQHNTEQIRTFYSFFQETIKNFSYEFSDANGKQLLYGKRAIKCFLNDLEQMKVDIHNTDDVLMYDGVRESIPQQTGSFFDFCTRMKENEKLMIDIIERQDEKAHTANRVDCPTSKD